VKLTKRLLRLASVVAATGMIAVLAACGGGGGAASASGDGKVTIRVATAVDNYYGYMPVIAHEQLGTFQGTNLAIEVVSATTPTIGQVLAANQADIAMAGAGALIAQEQAGVPVKLVAGLVGAWDYYVIVSKNGKYAGASRIEDLKGANFGITGKGSPGNYLLSQYAEKLGWGPNDYTETALGDVGSLFAAITSGSVDATLWAADQAYITEASGVATHFQLPDITPNVLQGLGVSKDFLQEQPAAVKEFLTAYFAKVKDLQSNPQQFTKILVDSWGVDPVVADKLAQNQLPQMSTSGEITTEQTQGLARSVPFLSGKPDTAPPTVDVPSWQNLGS